MAVKNINITFVKRNARKRGPLLSDQYNDLFNEIGQDLSSLSNQWNTQIVPLLAGLPDGTQDLLVNAFTAGLDAKTIFTDQLSTTTVNTNYFNTIANRPYTVYEQLQDLYLRVQSNQDSLQNQISNIFIGASNVSILDSANLFQATNVENALSELAGKIATIQGGSGSGGSADIIAIHLATTPHPTPDEKSAMQGTNGTPSASNKFVTNSDARLTDNRNPVGNAGGALSGTYPNPTVNGLSFGVLTDDTVHGNRGGGALHAVVVAGVSAGFMSAADKTKLDGISAGASATPLSNATPAVADPTAGIAGTSTDVSRADHKHSVTVGTPVGLNASQSIGTGSANTLARADHVHSIDVASGTVSAITAGATAADGTASGLSRKDHIHSISTAGPVAVSTSLAAGTSTSLARADHVHSLSFATVQGLLAGASSAISVNTQNITNVVDPVNPQDVATKNYVDNQNEITVWKQTVRAATVADVVLTGLQTIDGVSLIANDRILVKNASAPSTNGIYLVQSGAWTRSGDANVSTDLRSGVSVKVSEGTVNATTEWVLQTPDPIVLGTTAQVWVSQIEVGFGLVRTNNVISLGSLSSTTVANTTATDTTSAVTPTTIVGMNLTPGAGNYLVFFNGSFSVDQGGTTLYIALYANGVLIPHTMRRFVPSNFGATDIGTVAITTYVSGLLAGQVLDLRWYVNDPVATASAFERSFTLSKQ